MFNQKKKHFKDKLYITNQKIWDNEFLILQLREMREGFRREYDRIKEMVMGYTVRLEKLPKDSEEIPQVQAQIEGLSKDLKQLEEQMDGVDAQAKQSEQAIEGYRQVITMLEKHLKNI